jgi:hypothetical protein
MLDHLKVLDGTGSVMTLFVVTTPFGSVVKPRDVDSTARVEDNGRSSVPVAVSSSRHSLTTTEISVIEAKNQSVSYLELLTV